jgi:quercetin dioxygenase-like cupin family protein
MITPITFKKALIVPKGWGSEVQITNNETTFELQLPTGYSGKLLVYDKVGAVSSLHFHTVKHETFYVLWGSFQLIYFNHENADRLEKTLIEGDIVVIPPNNPHQLICRTQGNIVEFASTDYSWDNYRIGKGDSQKV